MMPPERRGLRVEQKGKRVNICFTKERIDVPLWGEAKRKSTSKENFSTGGRGEQKGRYEGKKKAASSSGQEKNKSQHLGKST